MERGSFFKLSNHPGSLGLSCGAAGLALAGVPLLREKADGFVPRSRSEIRHLLGCAYKSDEMMDSVLGGLEAVARSLNIDDIGRAQAAAVLLRLPDLDWDGAVRIAQAEDFLRKYSPDQPRDWRGRWTTDGSGQRQAPSVELLSSPATPEVAAVGAQAVQSQNSDTQTTANPFPLPKDWVNLPPGERFDELGDLLEWIANAKPEEVTAIADEIDRQFTQNGDLDGAIKLMGALIQIAGSNPTKADRQKVLDDYEYLTHIDPREAGQATIDNVARLIQLGIVPASPGAPKDDTTPVESNAPGAETPGEGWEMGGRSGKIFGT